MSFFIDRPAFAALPLAAACALLAVVSGAQAQTAPSAAAGNSPSAVTRHRIHTGDTLEQLARHYLGDATLWPQLQRHNQVGSPYRLQPGSVLEIPTNLLRMATASVDFIHGRATVLPPPSHTGSAGESLLTPGQQLPEGSRVRVAPDAFVSVRLADGSLLKVQADSELLLQQLRRKGRTGSLQSVMELKSGAVEASVPHNTAKPAALEIRTGVASSSVRGTEFGVYRADDGSTATAVLQGAVQVQAAQSAATSARVPKGQGAAVAANGQLQTAQLLPALAPAALPARAEDAQWLDLPLPAPAHGAGYLVHVSQDAQGREVLRNGRFTSDKVRFAALPDGPYYLQVQAVDALGIPGLPVQAPLTVKAHPVPPLYQTAPSAVLPSDAVDLLCTPVHGVQAYRIQVVAAGQSFQQPLRDAVVTDRCQLPAAALPLGDYQWRTASIRTGADGQPDQGPFAAPQDFRAAARPSVPDAAALQWDTAGGVPAMHWKGEPGQSFRIVVATTPEAEQPLLDTRVNTPDWQANGLGTGSYYLRIQARDPSGLESALSAARQFTILPWVRDGHGTPIRTGTGQELIAH